ncbi:MAG: 3-keto-5-aminohexanoate cleavage protein, partial [Chloroflexota bacterium]
KQVIVDQMDLVIAGGVESISTNQTPDSHAIEKILDNGKILNPARLLHGFDSTAWPMLVEAKKRGYDSRVGFEDTLFLPDGSAAKGNAGLVECAIHLLAD